MKKLWILVIAICVTFSMAAVAQDTAKSCDMGKSKMSAPLKTLKGTVKADGDKITFVNDADHKVYMIDAQDKVAAHAGHHVTVKGSVDGDNLKLAGLEMAK